MAGGNGGGGVAFSGSSGTGGLDNANGPGSNGGDASDGSIAGGGGGTTQPSNPAPAPNPTPTQPVPTPVSSAPTPTPAASPTTVSAPDAVSISPDVTYDDGTFTLTGTASSPAGVSSVQISEVVDGVRRDIGAAAVNPDGTFTVSDRVGDRQSVFIATETDNAGGQAVSADPGFSLSGAVGLNGRTGKEKIFDANQQVSIILFQSDGQRFVAVQAPDQTVDLQPFDVVFNGRQGGNTFVYNPGDGIDVIDGFKAGGADHDTLALPSSDFTNLADVLRNTGDVQGSAFITDPKTGDAIRLAGVTTAELKANSKDFTFHA